MWFVYALRCCDGSLYTGITTDPNRRHRQHNAGKGGAYTRGKRPVKLIFQETQPSRSSALKREAEIKHWPRPKKEALFTCSSPYLNWDVRTGRASDRLVSQKGRLLAHGHPR